MRLGDKCSTPTTGHVRWAARCAGNKLACDGMWVQQPHYRRAACRAMRSHAITCSTHEPTHNCWRRREEVLEAARKEREARASARTHARAAVLIQAAQRAYAARRAARAECLRLWQERFALLAAQPSAAVSAAALSHCALPLLLHALLPPASPMTARRLASGLPLTLTPGEGEAMRGTLALLLRSYASTEDSYWAAAGSPVPAVSGPHAC